MYNKYLSTREKEAGKIIWNPDKAAEYSLASGVYIIKMPSGVNVKTSKIMFIK